MFSKPVNEIVQLTLDADEEVIIHQGGSSSGKTYGLMQCAIVKCVTEPNTRFLVVGQDVPNLKAGAMADFLNILSNDPQLKKYISGQNKNDRTWYFHNGSWINFNSFDNAQDAKSGKREYSFFNEANGIPYDVYFEIAIRTTKQVWMDFNPNSEFWAHTEVWRPVVKDEFGKPITDESGKEVRDYTYFRNEDGSLRLFDGKPKRNVRLFKTNWRHNIHIPEKIRDGIEALKYKDPELYKVYGLGEMGKIEGLVFKNVEIVDRWPEDLERIRYGLDFGFSDDPTAMVRRGEKNNCLYLDELIYSKQMNIEPLARLVKKYSADGTEIVWADPGGGGAQMIRELVDRGCYVRACKKGDGSIMAGIKLMQSYDKIYITRSSTNGRKEANNYKYGKDKDNNNNVKPVDAYNHFWDAARYAELMKGFVTELRVHSIDFSDYGGTAFW